MPASLSPFRNTSSLKLAFTTISETILRTRTIDPRKWQGDFTYVDISSIDRETKRIVEPKTLPTDAAPSRARKELKKGDILVSTVRPNLNAVALVEQEFPKMIASTGFAVLRADPLKTLSKYLFYRCLTESFIQDMVSQAKGAGYPAVSDAIIGGHQLPLPTLSEQHRIVEILDQADTLRQQRRQADALSQKILPALFQKMFGDPVSNTRNWQMESLATLGRVVTGSTPPSKQEGMFDGPIPFVTPADLKETWIEHARSVTDEGASKSRTVREGSALVCCIGATIGKMGKASKLSAFNQQINAVEWYDETFDAYGIGALRQIKQLIISSGSSTTLPIINKSTFQALEIPSPPKELRMEFAERVNEIERITRNQSISAPTLETLFQTLLHRAFDGSLTAKWRESHAAELLQEMEQQAKGTAI